MVRRRKYIFADFAFDCASCQLSRNGRSLRIPDQIARLLALMLEAEGELITREQIRRVLWQDGEHLDYDHSINKAISQLRAILRDSSQSPRFLMTIPKRGYRFMKAHPLTAPEEETPPVTAAPATPAPEVEPIAPLIVNALPQPAQQQKSTHHRRGRKRAILWAVAALVLLTSIASFYFYRRFHAPAPRVVRIAIAPFEISGQGDVNLAESLRMDLADAIAQLPEVQVRALHSIQSSQSDPDTVRNMARTIWADEILYSKLTLDENRFVLQIEMIRGEDAAHLASFRYEGSRRELMSLRAKVQRDIFSRLELRRPDEQHALGSTNDAKAYEAYLRGRSLLSQRTDEALRQAFAAFQESVAADPHFAGAYAGMAHSEMILAEHEAISPAEGYRTTRKLALQALAEVPTLAEARALLGYSAFRLDWNFGEADRELRQAIELDPNESVYHVWYSVLLCDEGRFDESFRQIDLAHSLDPLWAPIYLTEAFLGAGSRRYDHMLAAARKLVELEPDWPLAHDQVAWSLWFAGHAEEAIVEWHKMAELEKDAARVEFEEKGIVALRRGGPKAYAELRLKACTEKFADTHRNDFIAAEWNAYAGRKDEAIALLGQEVARHTQYALEITVNPAFFDYHQEPRFQQLAMRTGLPLVKTKDRIIRDSPLSM